MPRSVRASVGGICYHVFNRGNARAQVFFDQEDYACFQDQLFKASAALPMRLLSYCLMPNHFHLVAWPFGDGDLTLWMNRLMNAHVRYHRNRWATTGHIWQGRFKAFPIEQDEHLLNVIRYVEYNPVKASLSSRAEGWSWSSARLRQLGVGQSVLAPLPVELPADWTRRLNEPLPEAIKQELIQHTHAQVPWGSAAWSETTAARLGLPARVSGPGRPRAC